MKNITNELKKVGETRKFYFAKDKEYEIVETIDVTDYTFRWLWDTGICPHCNKHITRELTHIVDHVEILIDKTKKDNYTNEDFVILVFTRDNRLMKLSEDQYQEIFKRSKNFKNLVK